MSYQNANILRMYEIFYNGAAKHGVFVTAQAE